MHSWGIHVSMKTAKTVMQNQVYMSFWTKGEVGNLQVDRKELTFGKQILAGPPRNSETQKGNLEQIFAWILSTCHTEFICAPVNMLRFSSRSKLFYLNLFRQIRGK